MCFGIFKQKPADWEILTPEEPELTTEATMTKAEVIEKLKEDILIHEDWAVRVTQTPSLAQSFGDYDWHMQWNEVYKNAIYYLEGGE